MKRLYVNLTDLKEWYSSDRVCFGGVTMPLATTELIVYVYRLLKTFFMVVDQAHILKLWANQTLNVDLQASYDDTTC